MTISAIPVGKLPDKAKPSKYLWQSTGPDVRMAADPTRDCCLHCPAHPAHCDQADYDKRRLRTLDQDGALHCLIAYARIHDLSTVETGEAGRLTVAFGLGVEAFRRVVRSLAERKRL